MPGDMGGTLELWRIRTRGWAIMLIQAVAILTLAYGVYNLLLYSDWIGLTIQNPELIELGDPLTKFGGIALASGIVLILTMR